jgi:hypothetical protein
MFEAVETAARRICAVSPNISLRGKAFVTVYAAKARVSASSNARNLV